MPAILGGGLPPASNPERGAFIRGKDVNAKNSNVVGGGGPFSPWGSNVLSFT